MRVSGVAAVLAACAACSAGNTVGPAASRTPPTATRNAATSRAGTTGASTAQRVFAAMSERQRVGQLLMVDCPSTGMSAATRTAITSYDVGAVILDGTNSDGIERDRSVTEALNALAPRDVGLFIATDQEGGEVQRLQGPGFADIPSAVVQGGLDDATLQSDARLWGTQLRAAGVNLDLAPVFDTVPAGFGSNPPIGDLDREYGDSPSVVTAHALAFAAGMSASGIDVTAKHFPGLGRVHGNTDTTSGVTDSVTTAHDADLAPFAAAVHDDVPFVMMSTAIYRQIDPSQPAAFSPTIVTGMLRDDLGFRGVIISDDLGVAAQVSGYPVGQRAVDFVTAGGDMVLTVDASDAQAMTSALLSKAQSSASFRKQVDAAALLVLQAKQARGLL